MSAEKYKAIVIKCVKYGEHDKMLTLFTQNSGKKSAVAKGASTAKSKFIGSSQLFCCSEFLLSESGKMPYVSGAEVLNGFYALDKDVRTLAAASFIAELLNAVFEEESPSPAAFSLLYYTLELLCSSSAEYAYVISMAFSLKLMGINGTYPVLDRCLNCEKKDDRYLFSAAAGGILCEKCAEQVNLPLLSANEAGFLYGLLYIDVSKLASVDLPDTKTQKYLLKTIYNYIIYVIEKSIKSYGLLDSLLTEEKK